jgi:hypothetical protein
MSKEDDYRQAAMSSLKLVETASPGEKVRLLLLATGWFKLAERCAQSIPASSEHPLPLSSSTKRRTQSAWTSDMTNALPSVAVP